MRTKNLQVDRRYHLAKVLSITLGLLTIPISTYCGYLLGIERYSWAFAVLGIEGMIYVVDLWIYWWMMEQLNGRK